MLTGSAPVKGANVVSASTAGLPFGAETASLAGRAVIGYSRDGIARKPLMAFAGGASATSTFLASPAAKPFTGLPDRSAGVALLNGHDSAAQTPKCAVAPLQPNRQSLQPDAAQVDWASQLAEQGLLTGSLGLPAG